MNRRLASALTLGLALSAVAAVAQNDATPPPDARYGAGPGGGQRGFGAMGGAMGRGVTGTVTEIAAEHYNIKTQTGETYTIHYSANTRFMKEAAGGPGGGAGQGNAPDRRPRDDQEPGQATVQAGGRGRGMRMGGPPQQIKSTDIKVGDAVAAMGEVDSSAKSVGAVAVLQLDPERAKQMEQMQANYGKTWLLGKVTAINEVQVTLMGSVDNAPHTFVADENTSFRERNSPITLADIHVDDIVRVEGSLKDGIFTATAVNVMRPPSGNTRLPRNAPPPQ